MPAVNYLPAGYSDFESDDEYGDYGDYCEKQNFEPVPFTKSKQEIFKENLILHLENNDVKALRNELDYGSETSFNIDAEVSGSWNLLFLACFKGFSEVVKFLIDERGANINLHVNFETPLIVTCNSQADSKEVLKIVKMLMKESTNINCTNSTGQSALSHSCKRGHIEVVELLLEKGVSIDAIDNYGFNALFHAIDGKQVEVAKKLIEAGIDLDITDKQGYTAKMYAAAENLDEIVKLFPPEEIRYQVPSDYLSYSKFETIVPNTLGDNVVPPFFNDISKLLHGMGCEKLVPIFAQAEISLEEFLTMSDSRMEEIGVTMPYQRAAIRRGLLKFFSAKWSKKSLHIPLNLKTKVSPLDLVYVFANLLRQTIVMKSQLLHYQQMNMKVDADDYDRFLKLDFIQKYKENLCEIEELMKKVKPVERPLLIKKKSKGKMGVIIRISCALITAAVAFKLFRK